MSVAIVGVALLLTTTGCRWGVLQIGEPPGPFFACEGPKVPNGGARPHFVVDPEHTKKIAVGVIASNSKQKLFAQVGAPRALFGPNQLVWDGTASPGWRIFDVPPGSFPPLENVVQVMALDEAGRFPTEPGSVVWAVIAYDEHDNQVPFLGCDAYV